jgi:hypothetical protein
MDRVYARPRNGGRVKRRILASVVLGLFVASCGDGRATPSLSPRSISLEILQSPRPFDEVAAGPVRALVPDRWKPMLAPHAVGNEGFFASPRPQGWERLDGSVQGIAATWIDVSRVGVPSDYYYLAANGPVLERLSESPGCRAESRHVIVNHRPAFFTGRADSPGDYVVEAEGVCRTAHGATRWAYFVAAPGYGPVRKVGIPSSGMYVVVAVLRDSRDASATLARLLEAARFGDAGVADFIAAAAGPVQRPS